MTRRKPLREFLERALAGRSQADLARELGVSKSMVHQWASGAKTPPERWREALRAAARPGRTVTPPPPRTNRAGKPVKTTGSATITPLPSGREHVHTHARGTFARELSRLNDAGRAPASFSVMLHGFRGADSKPTVRRSRRVTVRGLTAEEIRGLSSGRKDVLEDVITRAVEARNYSGGFVFDRATSFSFDSGL